MTVAASNRQSRDLDVLATLGAFRFASTPQVGALHFAADDAVAAKRLRQLHDDGLVTRVFMPVRPYDRRSHTVWALAGRGARVLGAERPEAERRTVPESERRSGLFLDHTLRRNDLRVCLALLERDAARGIRVAAWKQAPDDVRISAPSARGHPALRVVPDAFVVLERGGAAHGFDVEVDMGTVAPKRMAQRYGAYWRSRRMLALSRVGVTSSRVLTLTTTKSRLDRLRAAASAAVPRGTRTRLFWFSLLGDSANLASPAGFLAPGWSTSDPKDEAPQSLF